MGMDRRSLLKGLFGVVTTAAVVSLIPREAEAFAGGAPTDTVPPSDVLPKLEPSAEDLGQTTGELDEGYQLAWHDGRRHRRRRRRRRRRVRRWRRVCRRYRYRGRWRRGRCRRVPFWVWIGF